MTDDLVRLTLDPKTADRLHSELENLLESRREDPHLNDALRVLTWRILASKRDASGGLTARLAELAREAGSLEEYEAARDDLLGPLLGGMENPENRDP